VRKEKRAARTASAERATAATASTTSTAAAESRGFAPDRYGTTPADDRTSADRHDADRYEADRYTDHYSDRYGSSQQGSGYAGYGADERHYQPDRSATPVEDRYGATADDLAAAAGRAPINGRAKKAKGSTNGTASESDPAVEAATDEPTRRITRPAVD
jgi:hypothetical protein